MANLFHIIEGAQVIVHSRGVFKQVKAYRRGNDIYAAHSGGFIKLHGMNGTSHPTVSWRELDAGECANIELSKNGTPSWKE